MPVSEIWLTVLSVSFGLWALVVGWSVNMVIKRIDQAAKDARQQTEAINEWIKQSESRLTRLETLAEFRSAP